MIITPDHLEYHFTLATLPPGFEDNTIGFVADISTGLLRSVDEREMREYIMGGEYEERLKAQGYDDDFFLEDMSGVEEFYVDI